MATNTLEYAVLFQTRLDEQVRQELTTAWMEGNAGQVRYDGGDTVKVPKRSVTGLGAYDKATGYPAGGAVTLTYETFQLTQDRGQKFMLDARDVNEANFLIEAGAIMKQFQTDSVVPEVDSFRYSKIFTGANKFLKTAAYTPVVGTIYTQLKADITAIADKVGTSVGLVIMMPFTVSDILARSTELTKQLTVDQNFSNGEINTKVKMIDGIPIIEVSSDRMKSAYTFDATAGFSASAVGMQINWIIMARTAPLAITKMDKPKILAPESNPDADAWVLGYRRFHDLWIFDRAYDSVKVSYTAIAAPALTTVIAQGTASGSTKFTATPGSGNTLAYLKQAGVITAPNFNDIPTGLTAYISGADIAGAVATNYLGQYELDAQGHVVKFKTYQLIAGDIKP